MHRVVIFSSSASWMPAILIKGTLAALRSREDMELAAICVENKRSFASGLARYSAHRTIQRVTSLFDRTLKYRHCLPLPVDLDYWARRLRFRVISPPRGASMINGSSLS